MVLLACFADQRVPSGYSHIAVEVDAHSGYPGLIIVTRSITNWLLIDSSQ